MTSLRDGSFYSRSEQEIIFVQLSLAALIGTRLIDEGRKKMATPPFRSAIKQSPPQHPEAVS